MKKGETRHFTFSIVILSLNTNIGKDVYAYMAMLPCPVN